MRADAMLAEFQRQGGSVKWHKYDKNEAKATFAHPSGGSVDFSYSIEDAKIAGLIRPDSGWTKFPAAMLRARCISGGIRMVLPGVVCGVYTPEEVEDFDDKPKKQAPKVESKQPEAETVVPITEPEKQIEPPANDEGKKVIEPPKSNPRQQKIKQMFELSAGKGETRDQMKERVKRLTGKQANDTKELTESDLDSIINSYEEVAA